MKDKKSYNMRGKFSSSLPKNLRLLSYVPPSQTMNETIIL